MDEFNGEKAALKRPAFIEKLTERDGKHRRLVRGQQYYNLPPDQEAQARRLVEDYRKREGRQPAPTSIMPWTTWPAGWPASAAWAGCAMPS